MPVIVKYQTAIYEDRIKGRVVRSVDASGFEEPTYLIAIDDDSERRVTRKRVDENSLHHTGTHQGAGDPVLETLSV
jgi:hypothetical protein